MPTDHSPHILSSFDTELDQLRIDVIQMGNLALRAYETSVKGLLEQEIGPCNDVIADDEVIDLKEKTIGRKGMSILMRYSPVASDFRAAVSTLSISRSLERIGDHAVNIAKSGRKIIKHGRCPEVRLVVPLFDATRDLLNKALLAYTTSDSRIALEIIDEDRKLDKLHSRLSKGLTTMVGGGGSDVESILHLLFVSRYLERIGDLASNIGEDVVFISSAGNTGHS